ncbi:MAG: hypothetical protein N2Z22_03910 [Turneriella sp.]|nr:hypothetical protein [Turneriella sp.]
MRYVIIFCVALFSVGCRKSRIIATARENAKQYALARCECEKLARQGREAEQGPCLDEMQQARRFLMFNLEMGKVSEKEQNEIHAYGEKVYRECLEAAGN